MAAPEPNMEKGDSNMRWTQLKKLVCSFSVLPSPAHTSSSTPEDTVSLDKTHENMLEGKYQG